MRHAAALMGRPIQVPFIGATAGSARCVRRRGGVLSRPVSFLVAALGLALIVPGAAIAQTCQALQAELDYLQARAGGNERDRYERAYREQAEVLARTERRARESRCFGGIFLWGNSDRACRELVPKIREMQTNLWRLDRLRRQQERGSSNQNRIRQLQFQIAGRGCAPAGSREARRDAGPAPLTRSYARGTYRTLCVRTCDGYYFPISFSTTQDRLPEDARACEAMCPGTEAKLFFHDNPGGGPENMTALDGQAYTSLATAFRYRTALSDSCTCRPAGGYSVAVAPAAPGAPADPTAPLPRFRPAPDEDPETLANRAGSFTPGTSPSEPVATASVATSAAGGSIRLVGPPHWSSQEQDSLVLTPVPN